MGHGVAAGSDADVDLFVVAYEGLAEFFAEYEWTFGNIPEEAFDDPRLNRFDDEDLNEAGERIENYCGFEFIQPGPGETPAPPGPGTGGGPLPGTGLSETFPADLIPPDGELLATVNVSGSESATWDLTLTLEEAIAFYTDLLGAPTGTTPEGAIWVTEYEGRQPNVVVADADGFISVNVTIGP